MVKLVAVSDAHGDRDILKQIVAQEPDAAAYFYAGDSELEVTDPALAAYFAVRGNMDFAAFPETLTENIAGIPVFMAHGHRLMVNFSLERLIEAAKEAGARLAIFGHTHQLGVEQHEGIIVLNPGSIAQPRGQFAHLGGTYAVVAVEPAGVTVTYKLRDGSPAPQLAFDFPA